MASWYEQTEQDVREIERERDLPPDEPHYEGEGVIEWAYTPEADDE